ncbi:MAG: TonB family protein [Pyrinomonadaceae bacterium]
MFNNLVESGSHAGDFARKSSFFLGTLGIYVVLLFMAGVISIYAYDAHLQTHYEEEAVMLSPPEPDTSQPEPVQRLATTQSTTNAQNPRPQVVTEALAPVTDPRNMPSHVSTAPSVPPVGPGPFRISNYNAPAIGPGNSLNGSNNGSESSPNVVSTSAPPPLPEPRAATKPTIKSLGVIDGIAISKPPPPYPAIAKTARVHGPVTVQIIVDEAGKVISARPLSGHPLLVKAAVQAAYQARFTPTLLSKQPVKVSGVITYNFVLQ